MTAVSFTTILLIVFVLIYVIFINSVGHFWTSPLQLFQLQGGEQVLGIMQKTENKEGHILEIFFSQPIVKDRLKYEDPENKRKGYKIIKGSKNKEVSIKSNKGGRPNPPC